MRPRARTAPGHAPSLRLAECCGEAHVAIRLCDSRNQQASCNAHSTSELGQNENPPFWGLCQLPPAVDMPPHRVMTGSCRYCCKSPKLPGANFPAITRSDLRPPICVVGLVGLVQNIGALSGFFSFGFLADALGRKPTTFLYYLMCLILTPLVYWATTPLSPARPAARFSSSAS